MPSVVAPITITYGISRAAAPAASAAGARQAGSQGRGRERTTPRIRIGIRNTPAARTPVAAAATRPVTSGQRHHGSGSPIARTHA